MMRKINQFAIRAYAKMLAWKEDESGMEIIQVLILLALGVALVGVFMVFRDQIMGTVEDVVNQFTGEFSKTEVPKIGK